MDMRKDELHLRAPGNWINDPNGFIYYKGKYHLFYQYFPFAPVWGTMHWGHAVSGDLVHWEHLGVALFPTKSYDRNGVFSGSALEKDGKLYLYYSAVRYLTEDAENTHIVPERCFETSQAMIVSEDGYHFDNWNQKRQIIPVIRDEEIADFCNTRDPKVWKDGNDYYMIVGSTYKGTGRVIFYRSKDALNWEYANQLRDERYGTTMECPDLFQVSGKTVLLCSPMNILSGTVGTAHHAVCALAEFETESCTLALPEKYQFVDYGLDLYAPQTNLDEEGRRVMIGWMRMPKAVETPGETAWNGMMSLPRVVEVQDGHIYFRVHPLVEAYFDEKLTAVEMIDHEKPFRLKMVLQEGEMLDIGGYRITVEKDAVVADRSRVADGAEDLRLISRSPELNGKYQLDIFVDKNLVEIFINDGEYVLSNVVYQLDEFVKGLPKESVIMSSRAV